MTDTNTMRPMTPERARYFMERFKKEEKLLGPNEQAAVDYVLAMLERTGEKVTKVDVEPHKGCACRWDADDNRVATCVHHQGWLDVVQEWADRAKNAESALAALQAENEKLKAAHIEMYNAAVEQTQHLWSAQAENKRLREALEKIKHHFDTDEYAWEVAAAALKGDV